MEQPVNNDPRSDDLFPKQTAAESYETRNDAPPIVADLSTHRPCSHWKS